MVILSKRSGMWGKRFIHNKKLNKNKVVLPKQIKKYIDKGWVLGPLPKTALQRLHCSLAAYKRKNRAWNYKLTKKTDSRVKKSAEKLSRTRKGKIIVERETRFCLCGCGKLKIVKINEIWKYFRGHHRKGKPSCFLGRHHSTKNKKIIGSKRRGKHVLNKDRHEDVIIICLKCNKKKKVKYKKRYDKYCSSICAHRAQLIKVETRFCKCGCRKTFNCKITSDKKFLFGHCGRGRKHSKEHNAKVLKNSLKSNFLRPNKFETRALAYLNLIYDNKFKYTGDGSFIVNNRSADAYSKELKTIALFHGVYWHLLKKGYKITKKNKKLAEKKDALPFISAGYKVIFIWEDELDN